MSALRIPFAPPCTILLCICSPALCVEVGGGKHQFGCEVGVKWVWEWVWVWAWVVVLVVGVVVTRKSVHSSLLAHMDNDLTGMRSQFQIYTLAYQAMFLFKFWCVGREEGGGSGVGV